MCYRGPTQYQLMHPNCHREVRSLKVEKLGSQKGFTMNDELAKKLGRSAGSVSYKLANFASLDPSPERKGESHSSKLDQQVWDVC